MAVKIRLKGEPVGKQMARNFDRQYRAMNKAVGQATRETSRDLRQDIFKNIQEGGDFGRPWKSVFDVSPDPKRGPAKDLKAEITVENRDNPLGRAAALFEKGGKIEPKDGLLWIPFANKTLRQAIRAGGGVFSALSRRGKPLLFGKKTKEPVAVGVEEVHIRKRFDVVQTVEETFRRQFGKRYFKALGKALKK